METPASASTYTSALAGDLHNYNAGCVLSGRFLMRIFDPDTIVKCLEYLRVNNCLIMLESPEFDTSGWLKSKWYGTEYKVESFSREFIRKIKGLSFNSQLSLPQENQFIPRKLDILPQGNHSTPLIIKESELVRFWHLQEDRFRIPKSFAFFEFKTHRAYQSARDHILMSLYKMMVMDSLNEYSYHAEVAGLSYTLECTTESLTLTVGGYNDKLPVLLNNIGKKMCQFSVNKSRFDIIKDQLRKKTLNWFQIAPYSHAMYFVSFVTQEKLYSASEKLRELETISFHELKEFSSHIFESGFVEGFVHGNTSHSTALEYCESLISHFQYSPLDDKESLYIRVHMLEEGSNIVYTKDLFNDQNVNSAIEFCLQIGSLANSSLRSLLTLITQISQEHAFDQLRTKEQLGYMVYTGTRKQAEMISFRIIVQSEKSPRYLESRIENFIEKFEQIILELEDEDLESYKSSVILQLQEKSQNLHQESSKLWGCITSQYYDFDQHHNDVHHINQISKQDLHQFYKDYFSSSSPKRKKLSVHMKSKLAQEMNEEDNLLKNAIFINDDTLHEFKSKLQLNDIARPVADISTWIKCNK
ncbi:Insulinase (Peptidase M16) [Boothiomyces sp. JEL0838]|nr:Insulinase (Peptidase M16) [Boothiomyces sp. JEL0838]